MNFGQRDLQELVFKVWTESELLEYILLVLFQLLFVDY